MKHRHSFLPTSGFTTVLAGALLAAAALTTHAQTWETLATLGSPKGGNAVMIDPFSNPALPGLFIGGASSFGSVLHLDQSTHPATLSSSDPTSYQVQRLGSDNSGNLYSVGYATLGSQSLWQVRKSQDGGVTWVIIDNASTWSPRGDSTAFGVTADSNGNIYVSGQAYFSTTAKMPYWVIRKGANHGQSWSTVFTSSKAIAIGSAMKFVPDLPGKPGGVFGVGRQTPGGVTQWTVLRSRNSGQSWETVDAWTPAKNTAGIATGVTSDHQGNLFVIGYDSGGQSTPGWYVRASSDAGISWQTILTNYSETSFSQTRPNDVAADSNGSLYVVGVTGGLSNRTTWTVRRWDATMGTWDTWGDALRFPLAPGLTWGVAARGVAVDAAGAVYITGRMSDVSSGFLVVQRLRAN